MSFWAQNGKDPTEILDNFHHVFYMVTKDRIVVYADYLQKYIYIPIWVQFKNADQRAVFHRFWLEQAQWEKAWKAYGKETLSPEYDLETEAVCVICIYLYK